MAWGDGHRLDSASRRRQHALGLVRTRSLEREEGSGRFGEFRQANEFRRHSGHRHRKNTQAADDDVGSTLKRYVSFYFTNFPAQLSYFYLRKGFEVCGILEDVYVA
jgi:hypothetical protein